MKMRTKGKRILSLALVLVVLLTLLPSGVLPVYSKEVETHPDIDKIAKLKESSFILAYWDLSNMGDAKVVGSDNFPELVTITGVKVVGSTTYYQLSAALNKDWPASGIAAGLKDGFWLESAKVLIVEPCDKCGKIECGSSHGNWCDICKVDDCPNDHLRATVTDSEGKVQTIFVAGDLPDGAKLEVSIPEIDGKKLPNVFDIKVYDVNGNEWQPIKDGKKVTVAIPVADVSDGDYVRVTHYIDYTDAIKGNSKVEYVDIETFHDSVLDLLAPAIEASDCSGYVATEVFRHVKVSNGVAIIEVDSFSIYTKNTDGTYVLANDQSGNVQFDNDSGGNGSVYTYYASVGTTFTLVTKNWCFVPNPFTLLTQAHSNYPNYVSSDGITSEKVTVSNGTQSLVYKKATISIIEANLGDIIYIMFDGDNDLFLKIIVVDEVTLSYNANEVSGVTLPSNQNDISDDAVTFTVQDIVKVPNGYTFDGWNTSPGSDGDKYVAGQTITTEADIILYAMWRRSTYTIKYNTNGGTGTFADQTANYGTNQTLHTGVPTRAGYKFLGWSATTDGSSALYQPGATYSTYYNVTLYANWGVDFATSIDHGTIYYTKGDETVSLGSGYSQENTLLGSYKDGFLTYVPVSGYEITGVSVNGLPIAFTLESDGNYIHTLTDGITKENASIVVTTQKKINTVTFTIVVGEDENQQVIEVVEGSDIVIAFAPEDDVLKSVDVTYKATNAHESYVDVSGYIFTCSNIGQDVEIVIRAAYDVSTLIGAIDHGSISLTSNAMAQDAAGNDYVPYGANYSLRFTPDNGYKVIRINDNATTLEGDAIVLEFNGTLTETRALIAKTQTIDYEIIYNLTGGEIIKYPYTVESIIPQKIPGKHGYMFNGWNVTTADGNWTDIDIYDGMEAGPGMYGNVELTAMWSIITYTAHFDYDGDGDYEITKTYDITTKLDLTPVQDKTGYDFTGWMVTSQDGNWELGPYTSADVGMYGPIYFIAEWEINQYTITFNSNGGSLVAAITKNYNSTVTAPEKPTWDGWRFIGWYSDAALTQVFEFPVAMPAENFTLYAKWERDITTLTIEVKYPNGANYAIDGNQAFLFDILDNENKFIMTIAILNDDNATIDGLTIDKTYSVVVKNSWSWRYDVANNGIACEGVTAEQPSVDYDASTLTVQFVLNEAGKITFTMERAEDQWLDGNAYYKQ